MTDDAVPAHDRIDLYLPHVYGFLAGAVASAGIVLGDRLGLYRAMAGAGPVGGADLASSTGLNERFLDEWLRAQAAAQLIAPRDGDRFELTDAGRALLADEETSPFFALGIFESMVARFGIIDRIEDAFRTGVGVPYDAAGPAGARGTERGFAPWYRHMLVQAVLPGLDGMTEKLRTGAKVADVGCGAGFALTVMARAFPASRFHGYDVSRHALERAAGNAAGLDNLSFHDASRDPLPDDASFDLITAFDCIHDMTAPQDVLAAIRAALDPDGTFLIADIKSYPTFEENVEQNPMVGLMYGISVLSCLQSAMSEPGGAGLGTLGFHEPKAREMTAEAGFGRFEVHDFGHPINRYYEVRL